MAVEQVRFDIKINDLGSGPLRTFHKNAKKHVGGVQKLFEGLDRTLGRSVKKADSLSGVFTRLNKQGNTNLNKGLSKANGQMDRMLNKAGKLNLLMSKAGTVGSKRGGSSGFGFGIGAMTGFLGPLAAVAGMRSMINTGSMLQAQLVDIEAILSSSEGFSGAAFERMTAKMKQLGADTIFTSRDILGATKYLAMAGFQIEQIEQSMPAIANVAAIGNMPIDRAADIISNIQTSYGIAAKNMTNVSDVLARTMTSSNTDLIELGEALKYSGNQASSAGIDFKEISAAIGVLGNNGIKASSAGTNLRQMLIRMKAPTTAAQKVLDKYNYSFTETVKGVTKLKSLSGVVKDLNSFGMSPAELKHLFGVYGGSAFGALSTSYEDDGKTLKLDTITQKNAEAGGIAAKMAAEKMKSFRGSLAKLQAQFELFADNIFVRVEPVLTRVMNVLESMFKSINSEGSPAMKALATGINIIGNTLAWFYDFVKKNEEVLTWAAGSALALYAAYKTFTSIVAITDMVKGATVAWKAFSLALINNPIGWIATLIIGVGVAVIYCWNKFEGFRSAIFGVWELIKSFGQTLSDIWKDPLGAMKNYFKGVADFFSNQIKPLFDMIEHLKNGEWAKAAKAGGKLLFNLTPAGLAYNAYDKFANSKTLKSAMAKGHEKAKSGAGTIDFSGLISGFSIPNLGDIGNLFGETGDVSSSIPVRMGNGANGSDENGSGSSAINYGSSNKSSSGGLTINIENLLSVKTEALIKKLGAEGLSIKTELTNSLLSIIRETEASYGS